MSPVLIASPQTTELVLWLPFEPPVSRTKFKTWSIHAEFVANGIGYRKSELCLELHSFGSTQLCYPQHVSVFHDYASFEPVHVFVFRYARPDRYSACVFIFCIFWNHSFGIEGMITDIVSTFISRSCDFCLDPPDPVTSYLTGIMT
jgi:hypothetical protein